MSLLWFNGTFIDKTDARVSAFDHGLLYGDGVWEPLRVFRGKPFLAKEHLRILFAAAQSIDIDIPLSQPELLAAIEATVKVNNRTDGYVRVLVTRGPGSIGPDPRKIEPQVIVMAEEYQPFPRELYGHGLHAVVSPVKLDALNPAHWHRTLNQLHTVRAKFHAIQKGSLETIYETRDGHLFGTTEGVLFIVKAGTIMVVSGQPQDATATAVAASAGIEENKLSIADLVRAEEVFIVGTACGVIGIVRVEGKDIGSGTEGAVTRGIRDKFQQLTQFESL